MTSLALRDTQSLKIFRRFTPATYPECYANIMADLPDEDDLGLHDLIYFRVSVKQGAKDVVMKSIQGCRYS